jgi:hypothetical protein
MVAELRSIPERTESMTDEQWEEAKAAFPTARQCERCGRWLFSPTSIMRGFGARCAWLTALEALGEAVPSSKFSTPQSWDKIPVVEFAEVGTGIWEIYDKYDRVVGEIKRERVEDGVYWIYVWGDKVDFDTQLAAAKRRAIRVIENMGGAAFRYRQRAGVTLT